MEYSQSQAHLAQSKVTRPTLYQRQNSFFKIKM